ncbi:hypothetical protein FNH07_26950 [Amycolatopsis bartoniae]|nr:hypothetical protein FNH07_26950 [Amycolatopsis bartoniae]
MTGAGHRPIPRGSCRPASAQPAACRPRGIRAAAAATASPVRQHGSTAARQHGSTAARQHGSTAARQHGSTAARQHGSTAARQHGSTAARQHGSTDDAPTLSSVEHRTRKSSAKPVPTESPRPRRGRLSRSCPARAAAATREVRRWLARSGGPAAGGPPGCGAGSPATR